MFRDRAEAGARLGEALSSRGHDERAVVLGIPRGGVVVAAGVAQALGASLGVAPAAKIGAPGNPEYAIGAVAPDGAVTASESAGMALEDVRLLAGPARTKVERSSRRWCCVPFLADREVILVDDGLATGLTAVAAADWARRMGAGRVIFAVPVASRSGVAALETHVDEVVALETPVDFRAVGQFYERFDQTEDDEVDRLLADQG